MKTTTNSTQNKFTGTLLLAVVALSLIATGCASSSAKSPAGKNDSVVMTAPDKQNKTTARNQVEYLSPGQGLKFVSVGN